MLLENIGGNIVEKSIKVPIYLLIIFTFIGVVVLFFISFLIAVEDKTNRIAIISGLLSMLGGALGALGAYMVANRQIKESKRQIQDRQREEARPIVICTKIVTKKQNLSKIRFSNNARLFGTDFYTKYPENLLLEFFEIRFLKCKGVLNCNVNICMDESKIKKEDSSIKFFIGIVEEKQEILIPIPNNFVKNGTPDGSSNVVFAKITYETVEGEKLQFVQDCRKNIEEYSIYNDKNVLESIKINPFNFSDWTLPARTKQPINIKILES